MANFKFIKEFDLEQNLEALVYVNGELDDYYDPLTKIYILDEECCDEILILKNDTLRTYSYDLSDSIEVLVREKVINLYGWGTLNGTETIAFKNF